MKKLIQLIIISIAGVSAFAATSVTDDGITWTFDTSYTTGQFVNGEWWVVENSPGEGVTINSISPAWSGTTNGSMINPSNDNEHGLIHRDDGKAGSGYDASLNIATSLPYTASAGDSILTADGQPNSPYWTDHDRAFENVCVLTVLDSAPASNAFRPPFYGTTKTIWTTDDLDYDAFLDLAPTASAPTPASLTNGSRKEILINLRGQGGASSSTELKTDAAPHYGRSISTSHGAAALALNLNYSDSDKEALLIEMVQRGLDVYGMVKAGMSADADGGHRAGFKLPLFIAGKALDSSEILQYADTDKYLSEASPAGSTRVADYDRFQEGQQHFYVDQSAIDGMNAYDQSDLGLPDWKAQAWTSKDNTSNEPGGWGNGYRSMNGGGNTTNVLVATLMGGRTEWNHEAMFDYIIDYYRPWAVANGQIGGANGIPTFTHEMWVAYFDTYNGGATVAATPLANPVGGTFAGSQDVTLTTGTAGASIYYTTDGSTPDATDTLYSAPVTISTDTTLKAIAIKGGLTDSGVRTETYTFVSASGTTSTTSWQSIALSSEQTEDFTATIDATPNTANMDGVLGLASTQASAYSDLAAIVRFNTSGNIDVRDGGSYTADTTYGYSSGTEYEIQIVVDVSAATYDVTVTSDPNGTPGTPTLIADDFAFRTEQASASSFLYVSLKHESGSHTVDNIALSGASETADAPTWAGTLPGNYSSAQSVTITTNETGGDTTTRYTTDGTDVDSGDTAYSGAINVSATTTIKARTFKTGELQSQQLEGVFTIDEIVVEPEVVATVIVDIPGGNYGSTQNVTPSTSTDSATIYYTTNGTIPTSGSTEYTSGTITVSADTTLKFIGILDGFTDSAVSTYNYTIGGGNPDPDDIPVEEDAGFVTVALPDTFSGRGKLIDAVTFSNTDSEVIGGLSDGFPGVDSDLAIAWSTVTGNWEARNGSTWAAENTVAITAAKWQIRYEKKPASYSLYVRLHSTAPNGAWSQIADNYSYSAPRALDTAAYRSNLRQITVDREDAKTVRVIVNE